MPAVGETLRVEGLADLQRAFKAADARMHLDLRNRLADVAEPVRADAERMAVAGIPRIGLPWSRMRVGITTNSVYVAPKRRGSRIPSRKRPNLAGLLLRRSMEPALKENEERVERGFERLLDDVADTWERR